MAGQTANALRDALQGLSDKLDGIIDPLSPGDVTRAPLEAAQSSLENAAADVDAASIEAILTNNADLQKLKDLATQINAKASAIASSQANFAKIVGIADAAVKQGELLSGGGTVAAIVGAAPTLQTVVG